MSFNHLPDDPKEGIKHQAHTYTPRSHEELLKKFSRNTIRSEDVKDLKRENDYLKRELNNSKSQLRRLHRRMMALEGKQKKQVKGTSPHSPKVPESRSNVQSEMELDTDDDFVKSWEVLGTHFSEVIRRHHEVLAEKDRQIRELQDKQYSREIASRLLNNRLNNNTSKANTNSIGGAIEKKTSYDGSESGRKGRSDPDVTCQCECEDRCDCSAAEGCDPGDVLSQHFSEVIRRHKQQLSEKDHHIQELQEALDQCVRGKRAGDSEVQMWCHDYHEHSQPSSARTTDSEEEGSTDTFVAIERCQRLESIANLERLRQELVRRLQVEEKLDKLYWQTELSAYRALREEAGDNFDQECTLNKEFDMLETTRLELLRALQDLKSSAEREPDISVKPHCPSVLEPRVGFAESDSRRRVQFTEHITITTVQTKYDSASNDAHY